MTHFTQFCRRFGLPTFPLSDTSALYYLAHLKMQNDSLKPGTLLIYLQPIKNEQLKLFQQPAKLTRTENFLTGLRKAECGNTRHLSRKNNGIFNASTLSKIVKAGISSRDPTVRRDAFAITMATTLLLRASQICELTPRHVAEIRDNHLAISVPPKKTPKNQLAPNRRMISKSSHTKDHQFGDHFGLFRDIYNLCVHDPDTPFLVSLGISLADTTKKPAKTLTAILRRMLSLVGASTEGISSHSCRRSGTVQALSTLADVRRIQFHGCWNSPEAMQPYLRTQVEPSPEAHHFHGHLLPSNA